MVTVSVKDAESQLASLVDKAVAGEDVVLTKDDAPVARIVSTDSISLEEAASLRVRTPGNARGVVLYMSEDFDAPVDDFKEYM